VQRVQILTTKAQAVTTKVQWAEKAKSDAAQFASKRLTSYPILAPTQPVTTAPTPAPSQPVTALSNAWTGIAGAPTTMPVALKSGVRMVTFTGRSKHVPNKVKMYWLRDAHTNAKLYEDITGCEQTCESTKDPEAAELLISTTSPMKKLRPTQKTVHFSRESFGMHGSQIDKFDLTADMSPESNIPVLSVPADFWETMHKMPVPTLAQVKKRKLAIFMYSNCNAEWDRAGWVRELMKYMHVDCPGNCLRNMPPIAPRAKFDDNSKIYSNYLFVFSFHNAIDTRNFDEKPFYPFLGNTVPIVMADEMFKTMSPGPNSYINATAWKTKKELADHLLYLQKNPEEYLKLFAYRSEPKSPELLSIIQPATVFQKGNGCRFCGCISDWQCMTKRNVNPRTGYGPTKFTPP